MDCILCHGDDVDNMDQRDDVADGNNIWLGTNGHSNSAIGGTFTNAANIFDYTHGRPTPATYTQASSTALTTVVPDMAMQAQGAIDKSKGLSYRGTYSTSYTGGYQPTIGAPNTALYAYNSYSWAAEADDYQLPVYTA